MSNSSEARPTLQMPVSQKTEVMPTSSKTEIMPASQKTELMSEGQPRNSEENLYIYIGHTLKGRYKIEKVVTENTGEAHIFLCTDNTDNGETVIAKVYHKDKKPKAEVVEQLQNIESPYLIPILDTGEEAGRYFEIMPFYSQGDITQALPVPMKWVTEFIIPNLNDALHTLHQNNIFHKDIKPDNLFLNDARNAVILGDFGRSSLSQHTRITFTTALSYGYSPPEAEITDMDEKKRITFHTVVSEKYDYFMFGMTVLHLVTGHYHFEGVNNMQVSSNIRVGDIPDPPAATPKRVKHLIQGLTRVDKKNRWGHDEVTRWLNGENVEVQQNVRTALKGVKPYFFQKKEFWNLEDLSHAFIEHPTEAKKHLYRGYISDYLKGNWGQDLASDIADYVEEERNQDWGLLKSLHALNPELPLCWKNTVFADLQEFSDAITQEIPQIKDDCFEMFQSGALLFFLENHKDFYESALIKGVKELQELSKNDKESDYYRMHFLLSPSSEFQFNGGTFQSEQQLSEYLLEQVNSIDSLSSKLVDNPYFFAWLHALGFGQHVERWKKVRESSDQRESSSAPSQQRASSQTSNSKTITNSIGMEFIKIPSGSFMMGSDKGSSDEKPVHRVVISRGFHLGKYAVTQKEWVSVMGSNPSSFKGDDLPVEQVSWDDVQAFIQKLNRREGSSGYGLPTEAEWEYACRAGTSTEYSFGSETSRLDAYAWFKDNSNSTYPVGVKKANPWGLYDMHGNVWEWCSDYYGSDYYSKSSSKDPQGHDSGGDRVGRGGSWGGDAWYLRCAYRSFNSPVGRSRYLGFRLLRM